MALKALAVDLTGDGLVTAELLGLTRVTSQVIEAAVSGGTARATSQVIEAAVSGGTTRVTSQVVEVAFPFLTVEALATTITSSAIVSANLALPSLRTAITGSATVVAGLGESKEQLNVNLGTLTGSATVGALLETNLEHASNILSLTQNAATFVQHLGSTLGASGSVDLETVLNPAASSVLSTTQTLLVETGFDKNITQTVVFYAFADFKHVLPTETASSSLSLTDEASAFNQVPSNTLNLTDTAVGVIGGILESASSTLSLTDSATLDLVTLGIASSSLFLTHSADPDQVTNLTASSTLVFNQLAFGTPVKSKCLVILQAPFDFLQTSIVVPCPLFGDTENIVSEVTLRRSMNGATQTHVKTNPNRRLNYTFRILDRLKAVEVVEFFKYYNSDKIRLTNWKGEVWKVNLLTNPIDFVKTGRFRTDVSLEFEGEKLYG